MPRHAAPPDRPAGITWLAILCGILGVGSLSTATRLLPLWYAGAKQHHYGTMAFVWVALLSAVSMLAAAYGLWAGRRWARIPFLVAVLLGIASIGLVTMFGAGTIGGQRGWAMGVVIMVLVIAVAAALLRYVWRST